MELSDAEQSYNQQLPRQQDVYEEVIPLGDSAEGAGAGEQQDHGENYNENEAFEYPDQRRAARNEGRDRPDTNAMTNISPNQNDESAEDATEYIDSSSKRHV